MGRAVLAAGLIGLLGGMPLAAQEFASSPGSAEATANPVAAPCPHGDTPAVPDDAGCQPEAPPWQTAWGLVGLRIFADGPKVAPNGEEYHPSFTTDLDLNFWIWQRQGFYLFADLRFWGERPEYGVTNTRDGGLGFSKRQFDLQGGPAWNYAGAWEARVSGYSFNNLNRGSDPVKPHGINDGALLENRYYLSQEYEKLGQTGYDVAQATFLSAGYYPTKEMVGNDGKLFHPGLMLRAYLTYDLGDWPVYAFGDATFIGERSFQAKLLLFDLGVAARPFRCWRQWEFRLGVENTADFRTDSVLNLWYVSARFIF
jgi:hypothetical protein